MTLTPEQRHNLAEAKELLDLADQRISANWPAETGESKTDILLAALVHAILATVK